MNTGSVVLVGWVILGLERMNEDRSYERRLRSGNVNNDTNFISDVK